MSCASKPTDLRTLAPTETLVYLETNDLAKTLNSLTESKAFQELAKEKPDFSAFENVQAAVVITGFEASEQKVTDENSVLNFKPHFAVIADTHAWKPTAVSIAENQIGKFARDAYGDDVKLERSEKRDAKFFVWTSTDGRKLFSAVSNSVIYVGNDENLLDKCLSVKRGEAESLLKNENLARARENATGENLLAFGYISPEGVAQIANLAGVSTAIETTEENAGRSFIAQILPQILRNTTKEIVWTANKSEQGIEDNIFVSLNDETASVFKETLAPNSEIQSNLAELLSPNIFTATRYSLKNPLVAWRSLLLTTVKNTDALNGKILVKFSNNLLESYGVSDAETFLSSIDSDILTAQFDVDGEKSIAIVTVQDAKKLKKSISDEINFKMPPEKQDNADIWLSEDKQIATAFVGNKLILGDSESVLKCLQAKQSGQNFTSNRSFQKFVDSRAVSITFAKDMDSAEKIVKVLGNVRENKSAVTAYTTETRFTEKGIERKTVSAFGLLGTILEQLED
ncbi:MAG TPA: hypothetical protein VNI60_00050 [Pyrinomonadaceae bacterium]|nr:hypothetical protein [Pyrinomonadaceae bacterium]